MRHAMHARVGANVFTAMGTTMSYKSSLLPLGVKFGGKCPLALLQP